MKKPDPSPRTEALAMAGDLDRMSTRVDPPMSDWERTLVRSAAALLRRMAGPEYLSFHAQVLVAEEDGRDRERRRIVRLLRRMAGAPGAACVSISMDAERQILRTAAQKIESKEKTR